jgi:hypothetical protein
MRLREKGLGQREGRKARSEFGVATEWFAADGEANRTAKFWRSETAGTVNLARIAAVFHSSNKQNTKSPEKSWHQITEQNNRFIQVTHCHHEYKHHLNDKNSRSHNDNSDHMDKYLSMLQRKPRNLNRSTCSCTSTDIAHHIHNSNCILLHPSCTRTLHSMNLCNTRPSLEWSEIYCWIEASYRAFIICRLCELPAVSLIGPSSISSSRFFSSSQHIFILCAMTL